MSCKDASRPSSEASARPSANGESPWLPPSATGLRIWCKSDGEITLDGGDVSDWGETGGSLVQVSQATGSKQPSFIGANDGVEFDGSDDQMSSPAISLSGDVSIFTVGYATVNGGRFYCHGGSSDMEITPLSASVFVEIKAHGSAGKTSTFHHNASYLDTTHRLWEQHCDGTHANHKLFINGSEKSRDTITNTADPDTELLAAFALGMHDNNGFLNGRIKEWLVYSPTLSDEDRDLVRSYLNGRWGLY